MAVTIQQIADACGVSRGTVDRALHHKKGIRPEVALLIQKAARKMGYFSPQMQPPADSPAMKIGIVLHTSISPFMQILSERLQAYPMEALLPVTPIMRTQANRDINLQLALIDELVTSQQIDGLILAPLASDRIRERINTLTADGIPVITVNTDIKDSGRLAYVGSDSIASGRAAAALLGLAMGGHGMVLPLFDQQSGHYADSQRINGFIEEMLQNYPDIQLLPPVSCYFDVQLMERTILRELQKNPLLTGIYPSVAVHTGVFQAVRQMQGCRKIHIVVHDLTPDNLKMVRSSLADFAIGQGIQKQGTLPLRLMYYYLAHNQLPKKQIYLTDIEIKFPYNISDDDFTEY